MSTNPTDSRKADRLIEVGEFATANGQNLWRRALIYNIQAISPLKLKLQIMQQVNRLVIMKKKISKGYYYFGIELLLSYT